MQRELVEKDKFQIYSSQERIRRDNTIWTLVQGILAPVQFIVFIDLFVDFPYEWLHIEFRLV